MKSTESSSIWSQPPEDLDLQPDRADVWRILVDLPVATVKKLASTLSADEARHADRFHFPADRQRYIAAHGGSRDILARYLNCDPKGLCFSANEYGKPAILSCHPAKSQHSSGELARPGHPKSTCAGIHGRAGVEGLSKDAIPGQSLEFNLSHSGDFALVAITQNRKIGIDVERIRSGMEIERIAQRFFSQDEVSELMAAPPEQRRVAFFNCWTRKEAYIKAHGLGLSLPLDSFDVSLGEPAILRATRPDPEEAGCWTLLSLGVDLAYTAAVAIECSVLSRRVELVETLSKDLSLPAPAIPRASLEFRFWDWNPIS